MGRVMTMRGVPFGLVRRSAALALVAGMTLAGCSDSDSPNGDATPSAPTDATTLDDGTTAPGTQLQLRDTATVQFKANAKHDSLIALTVTSIKQGKIKDLKAFDLSKADRKSQVYYVKATVKNVGDGDLSGQPLTLYGAVSDTTVVPPVEFGSTYERCDYDPLPEKFKKPKKAKVCMVMLAPNHGMISEVQWRAADNADPISWPSP